MSDLYKKHFLIEKERKDEVLKKGVNPEMLLSEQKNADKAKSLLGKKLFKDALSLYFRQFINGKTIDKDRLSQEFEENENTFVRHLGEAKFDLLKLILEKQVNVPHGTGLLSEFLRH